MSEPHKHAEQIKAWADGAKIEYLDQRTGQWVNASDPSWSNMYEYRVKKEPVITYAYHGIGGGQGFTHTTGMYSSDLHVPDEFETRAGRWKTIAIVRTKFVDGKVDSVELV
jgi:hypothetical protein